MNSTHQSLAGIEQFTSMCDLARKDAQGVLFVYSITDLSTFAGLSEVRDQIIRVKDIDDFPAVLVEPNFHNETSAWLPMKRERISQSSGETFPSLRSRQIA